MRVDLQFCGREAELAELERRWLLASDIADPRPQLVVLAAERGLGKTRLVAEFYSRIAQCMQRGGGPEPGYWPDGQVLLDRQIALNPALSHCDLGQPAPFLWWGIAGQEGGIDALAMHDRHLIPHLVALSMKAKLLATGRTLAKLWLDVGVDFVVGLTGFDTIVSVGKGAFETARIVSETGQPSSTLAAQNAAQQISRSRADAILADLEQVLNPNARLTFAKVPAVIVIDDAQFARDDPALTRLFERLLFQAQRDRWPLMIIVTHWAREYALDWNESGRSIPAIIRHAAEGNPSDPGPAAGVAGGYLPHANLLKLELATVPDLSAAVVGRLPGLKPEQVAMLVEKTDGNGRFLEQVLAFAEANPRLFVDFDWHNAFTDAGASEIEAKSTNILEVVTERLSDTLVSPEVRQSLALASFQGIRAIREIVNEVGEELLGKPLGEPMLMGDDPHSLIVFDDERSVGKFAERLFLQAASGLRYNIRGLHEDHVLQEALGRALMRRLADQGAGQHESDNALEAMSIIAFEQFGSSEDSASREIALTSLAVRLKLARRMANPEVVSELVERFFAQFRPDPDLAVRIPHDALLACADGALWLDRIDDAAAIVSWRVRLNHEQSGGQVDAASAPAVADWLERNTTVEGLQGNDREALLSLNAVLNLRQGVLQQSSSEVARDAYAQAARTLARLQEMHGQSAQALATANTIVASYRQPSHDSEAQTHGLRGLGWALDFLASTATNAGELDVARASHEESVAITRKLVREFNDQDDLRNLSAALNKYARAELYPRGESCLAFLEESVSIMRALTHESPRLELIRDLAVALTCLARCHEALERPDRALKDIEEASMLLVGITDRLPTLGSADDVIASLENLRKRLIATGDGERAREVTARLVAVADRQGEVDPRDKAPWKARLIQAMTERELGDEVSYGEKLMQAHVVAMERLQQGTVSPEIAFEIGTIFHLTGEFQAKQEEWGFAQLCFATGRNVLFEQADGNAPEKVWQAILATAFSAVSTLGADSVTDHRREIQASFAVGVRQAKAGRLRDAAQLANAALQAAATLSVEEGVADLRSLLEYIEQASSS